MLFLVAVAFACLCEHLGMPPTSCVNDTLVDSSSYDICPYTQASIDCGLMTCVEALPAQSVCRLTCECAPGCTMPMLYGGDESYCNPACDNDACNHCLSSVTTPFSNCPELAGDLSRCLDAITTADECYSNQAYIDCYLEYSCVGDKINSLCTIFEYNYPNCTFDCTSNAAFLHGAIALLLGL